MISLRCLKQTMKKENVSDDLTKLFALLLFSDSQVDLFDSLLNQKHTKY